MAATTTSIVTTTQIVHVSSGGSLAPNAISVASDISSALSSTNLKMYPLCDVALKAEFSASIASASQALYLYARHLNIDGTNDEKAPDASNRIHLLGAFKVPGSTTVSTTHYCNMEDVPLHGGEVEFYLENGTGVNLKANWTLKITPKSLAGNNA